MPSKTSLLAAVAVTLYAAGAVADPVDADATPADALLLRADAVLETIQQLRGVYATGPIDRDVATRATLRDRLVELVALEMSAAELAAVQRSLHLLGVLDADDDYLGMMLDLLEEQIAGFYDDRTKVFYILDDMDPQIQEPVMAHELFHGVQDQVFGLTALREASKNVTDITLARTALIEGDALAVMFDYAMGGAMDVERIPMLDGVVASTIPSAADGTTVAVPEMLWEQLVYPYTIGMSFVLAVARDGGWAGVDDIYADPPMSTEQVLHPERYLARDEPTWITWDLGDAVVDGERYLVDIFGEFTLASLFRQLLDGRVASGAIDRAAAGWDGDRTEFWRFPDDPDRGLFVMLSVWDDDEQARQFAAVSERVGPVWVPGGAPVRAEGEFGANVQVSTDEATMYIERWADLVLVVLDAHGTADGEVRSAQIERVVDAVWSTHQRSRYPEL